MGIREKDFERTQQMSVDKNSVIVFAGCFRRLFVLYCTKTEQSHHNIPKQTFYTHSTMEVVDHREAQPKTSLLEDLRKNLVAESIINPTTEKDAEQKMNLILLHQSEFPLKLRASIREAEGKEATGSLSPRKRPLIESGISRFRRRSARKHQHNDTVDPEIFLHDVYEAVKVFFLGFMYRALDADQQPHWLLGWHGLDQDVDTEDEAELAIRCFPSILTQTTHLKSTGLHHAFPIHMLLSDSNTVCFLPLICELGIELGGFQKEEKGGLECCNSSISIVSQLLCNRIASTTEASRAHYRGQVPNTEKADQESLVALIRLWKKGLVTKEDIRWFQLIIDLFYAASYRELDFIEERLRLLIDWNPDVLLECDDKMGSNLLYASCIWNGFRHKLRFCGERTESRIFEVIFERGLHYFPSKIGFLFHNDTFVMACKRMGTDRLRQMVYVNLLKTLGQSNNDQRDARIQNQTRSITLQNLVIAAAADEGISLDGVYNLIRFDPTIALMPQCYTITR